MYKREGFGEDALTDLAYDPTYNLPGPVVIVLGSDVFLVILQSGQIKGEFGIPVAQNKTSAGSYLALQSVYTEGVPSNLSIVNLHAEVDINRTSRQF